MSIRPFSLWMAVAAWCGVIFYLSGIPDLSSGLESDFVLRKMAHMTEYAVLFLLGRAALSATFPRRSALAFAGAAVLAVLFAVSDEYHQSFVPGRTGAAADVLVDTAGVVLGGAVFLLSSPGKRKKEQVK